MNLRLDSYETDINILFGALLVHIFIISYMYFFISYLSPRRIKRRANVRGGAKGNKQAPVMLLGARKRIGQTLEVFEQKRTFLFLFSVTTGFPDTEV